jgi:hypothetical protein
VTKPAQSSLDACAGNINACLVGYIRYHGGQVNRQGVVTLTGYHPGPSNPGTCGARVCYNIFTGRALKPSLIPAPPREAPVHTAAPAKRAGGSGCGPLGLTCGARWLEQQGSNVLGGVANGVTDAVLDPSSQLIAEMVNSMPTGITADGQLIYSNDASPSSTQSPVDIGNRQSLLYKAAYYLWPLLLGPGDAAEAVPNEGIYFVRTPAGDYVGQSGNITQRLARHIYSGKFTQAEVDAAERIAVSGGKTAREIAEQLKIDEMGGIDNLLNVRNPIGPARFSLMPDQPYVR